MTALSRLGMDSTAVATLPARCLELYFILFFLTLLLTTLLTVGFILKHAVLINYLFILMCYFANGIKSHY